MTPSLRRPPPPAGAYPRATAAAALLASVAIAFGACSSGPGEAEVSTNCGSPITEPLDPQSVLHLLPGAPDPGYDSDPPTSGPHVMNPAVSGALGTALDRPTQVGVLERSGVMIQYDPSALDTDGVEALEALATDEKGTVVVAPNGDLPDPVVATAWTVKLTCDGPDITALTAFVDDHLGTGSAMS